MSNLLKIPFSKIREEGQFKEIFLALERGFIKFGIDFYLVGATARDVWMKGIHDLPPKRATSDIDFGIMIKDSFVFDNLKSYLIEEEGFVPSKGNEFVLIWKDKNPVDLIPFGDLEREGIVTVKGTGFTSMNVEGFREVYEQASEEITTEDIDLVQIKAGPIKPIKQQLEKVIDFFEEDRKTEVRGHGAKVLYRFVSEYEEVRMRVKLEINCKEHFNVLECVEFPFEVINEWYTGAANIRTYNLNELIGNKMRAF